MIIAQFTDMHLPAESDAASRWDEYDQLNRVIDVLNSEEPLPDVTLITGDLTRDGSTAEYQRLKSCLSALRMPYFLIPGNHDDRDNLRAVFGKAGNPSANGPFIQYVVEDYPLRLIALDTVVPGQVQGSLCSTRLGWLRNTLNQAPDQPTLLFMHHPPFSTGSPGMDRLGCVECGGLREIAERNPQIQAIVAGHVHRAITSRWDNIVLMTIPSTAYQFHLDMDGFDPPRRTTAPPGFALHRWQPESGLISHVLYLAADAI